MASEAAKKKIAGLLSGAPKGGDLPRGLLSKGSMSKYTPTMREKIAGLLAKNWYGDTREGYQNAERLVSVGETVVPPLGLLSGSYDAGRALGGGNMMQAGVLGGLAMLPLPGAAKKGIRAYHGSPHSFDKFSMDKIGTGEGAQAYGHGLYFADQEGTAKAYRDAVSAAQSPANKIDPSANGYLSKAGGDKEAAIKLMESDLIGRAPSKHVDYMRQQIKSYEDTRIPGHMYEVNIDADPDQFLDWDKRLGEQPDHIKTKLSALAKDYETLGVEGLADLNPDRIGYAPEIAGNLVYDRVRGAVGKEQTARELAARGIPGIKYLDAGSRAKGDGSRNYVVFDENLISIVRKYGIAGASTILGYDLLSNVTTDQAETLKQAERVY